MKKITQLVRKSIAFGLLTTAFIMSSQASASLIVRDGGMVYDDVLDITWLQDADYGRTSGYYSGKGMTWDESNTWAENLVFGGYDDWRLFNSALDDNNCSLSTVQENSDTIHWGANCNKNEFGHLFYDDFGLSESQSIFDVSGDGLINLNLFINVAGTNYWSATDHISRSTDVFYFNPTNGYQSYGNTEYQLSAWAVRDGDVANAGGVSEVPEPGSLALFGLAILGLGGRRFSSARSDS